MIRDGKSIATGTRLYTQVCIIGSGPAGITAAWYLQRAGLDVILIEGSRDYRGQPLQASWPDKVLLYDGVADGLFATNEPDFLIRPYAGGSENPPWERERLYGGTSNHWGGQSRPLSPITFVKRPGFPGWPISRADLDPYYSEAARLCKLHGADFTSEYWADVLDAEIPRLAGFDVEMYQFVGDDYLNFATRTFDDGKTIGDTDVDVILNCSLLEIDHQQGAVSGLYVASMDTSDKPKRATEFTIRAEVYILACGAVANARQLLVSNAGNEHDMVGRYFMCHPLTRYGVVSITNGYLTPDQQRLMSGHLPGDKPWKDGNGVWVEGRFVPNVGFGRCWFWAGGGQYYFEMVPNPDSRVRLTDTVDPVFGQRQTRITWELGPGDELTYNQTTALFKAAVKELGGDVSFASWEEVKSQLVDNGHHIGTTRMSDDPTQGVVDRNLKVHSLDNLYVAGSSVYPSTDVPNPTFTIITLSIRLADHVTKRLYSRRFGAA